MKRDETNIKAKLNLLEEKNIDPYKVFEVDKTANMTQIKNAYKRKARIYHPDKGGSDQQLRIITMAYMSIMKNLKDNNRISNLAL